MRRGSQSKSWERAVYVQDGVHGKPLKIALLTLKFSPLLGGDVTHTAHLAHHLAEQGIETHIITIRSYFPTKDRFGESVRLHRLSLPATTTELETLGLKRLLYMISSFFLLLRLLFQDRLDLVHAHGWDPAVVGGFFTRIFGVPFVLTVHGIPKPRDSFSKTVFQLLERWILRLCSSKDSRMIALTKSDRYRLMGLGVDEKTVDLIPNGINIGEFEGLHPRGFREKYGISSDRFLALFVGRLHEQKGFEVLIRAAKHLKGEDVCFVAVGSGHKADEYLKLVDELGVENIIFTGEIDRGELLDAFISSDIFVLPSIFEGMPYVVLEAMAAGKPVVASRLPEIAEVVEESGTGILFEKDDDNSLARAILRLKNDRETARRMGKLGKRLIADRFDWRMVFQQTTETYRKVL